MRTTKSLEEYFVEPLIVDGVVVYISAGYQRKHAFARAGRQLRENCIELRVARNMDAQANIILITGCTALLLDSANHSD